MHKYLMFWFFSVTDNCPHMRNAWNMDLISLGWLQHFGIYMRGKSVNEGLLPSLLTGSRANGPNAKWQTSHQRTWRCNVLWSQKVWQTLIFLQSDGTCNDKRKERSGSNGMKVRKWLDITQCHGPQTVSATKQCKKHILLMIWLLVKKAVLCESALISFKSKVNK